MAFNYPWTNLHELNLNWILSQIRQLTKQVSKFVNLTASAHSVPYGSDPTVDVTGGTGNDPYNLDFGIPESASSAVNTVNGQSGDVVITASDIGLGNVDNVQQYSATNPPPYPVTSVNGMTGNVTVTAPVTSVNGMTGDVIVSGGGGGWWGWQPNYEQDINNEINNARNWLSKRTNNFYTMVANYYKLGTPTPLVINKDLTEEVSTIVNGVTIRNADFDGKFFANRQLTVEAKGAEGREVKGWKVEKTNNNNTITTTEVNEPVYSFAMPSCKKLKLTAIMGTADGINDLAARDWNWRIDGSQLVVSGVNSGTHVLLYDVRGMLLGKVRANGADIRIPLTSNNQMYVLKVGAETVKILK